MSDTATRTPAALAKRAAKRREPRGASIPTAEQQRVARARGAWAGTDAARPLWNLSKRELVEAALHLAALTAESYDEALATGAAAERVLQEIDALDAAGMI